MAQEFTPVLIDGIHGRKAYLDRERLVLGAAPDCDVLLVGGAPAGHDAEIVLTSGGWCIRRLPGGAPLSVEEHPLREGEPLLLTDGCQILLGSTLLLYSQQDVDMIRELMPRGAVPVPPTPPAPPAPPRPEPAVTPRGDAKAPAEPGTLRRGVLLTAMIFMLAGAAMWLLSLGLGVAAGASKLGLLFLIPVGLTVFCAIRRKPLLMAAQSAAAALLCLVSFAVLSASGRSGTEAAMAPFMVLSLAALLPAGVIAIFGRVGEARQVGRGLLWGGGAVTRGAMSVLVGSYAATFAYANLGLRMATVGVGLTVIRILAALVTLLIGYVVDVTRLRLGKGRTYELAMLGAAALGALLYLIPSGIGDGLKLILFLLLYGLVSLLEAVANVSEGVYLYYAFPADGTRGRDVAGTVGALLLWMSSLLMSVLTPTLGRTWLDLRSGFFIAALLLAGGFVLLRFLLIREKPEAFPGAQERLPLGRALGDVFRDGGFLLLLGAFFLLSLAFGLHNSMNLYFFNYVLDSQSSATLVSLTTIAAMLAVLFFVPLTEKGGRDLLATIGLGAALLGQLLLCLGAKSLPLVLAGSALSRLGCAPLMSLLVLYVLDRADASARKTGRHVVGLRFSLTGFAAALTGLLSPALVNLLLASSGYVAGESVANKTPILLGFGWIPAILILISLGLCILKLILGRKESRP